MVVKMMTVLSSSVNDVNDNDVNVNVNVNVNANVNDVNYMKKVASLSSSASSTSTTSLWFMSSCTVLKIYGLLVCVSWKLVHVILY